MITCLVSLDTTVRLAILPQAVILRGLVVAAIVPGAATVTTRAAAGLAALMASLVRVNLALGELASADTLVGLPVLAETVMLWSKC